VAVRTSSIKLEDNDVEALQMEMSCNPVVSTSVQMVSLASTECKQCISNKKSRSTLVTIQSALIIFVSKYLLFTEVNVLHNAGYHSNTRDIRLLTECIKNKYCTKDQ